MTFVDTSFWVGLRNRRDDHHAQARALLQAQARSPRLTVLTVTEPDEETAIEWLRRHDEREYSFVDATSFAAMQRVGLREALAFDGDVAAAGFVELRA